MAMWSRAGLTSTVPALTTCTSRTTRQSAGKKVIAKLANRDAGNRVPVFLAEEQSHRQIRAVSAKLRLMIAILRMPEAIYLMQIFASAFLAILFLQSGIDKIVDRRGNLEWLSGHFAKSPLAGIVPALLICITILEVAAGALSAVGCLLVILLKDSTIAFYGAILSAAAITALFFGQRIAKEYAGAAVLVPYFLLTLVAIYLLAQG